MSTGEDIVLRIKERLACLPGNQKSQDKVKHTCGKKNWLIQKISPINIISNFTSAQCTHIKDVSLFSLFWLVLKGFFVDSKSHGPPEAKFLDKWSIGKTSYTTSRIHCSVTPTREQVPILFTHYLHQ